MLKGVKLRLYPNAKQRDQLTQMFGNNRFIWNIMLNMANERYKNNPSSSFIDEYGMNYLLPRLKREYPFLNWYLFREMLEYKCKWYGKKLIKVSPNYTSQICSNCGYHSGKKPLEIREWTCPKCNTYHDRDINASINILNRGLKELNID